uniref:Putative nuclease HARBI1 n=1 Tax=Dendroctonus ponderosae TaxID=77166 RepID=A0AAR5QEP2_DENPD
MAGRNMSVFDSDEEDDMFDNMLTVTPRRPKVFKNRPNYFIVYTDLEFFTRFRMQKQTCETLLHLIVNDLKSQTERNRAILPATKLLLTLRFYATGNMLISVGDFVGVSKTSACTIVKQVSEAIARLRPRNIRFPENIATKQKVQENFYRVARFPMVIGAIDCTHVKIQSPGGEDAERFRNRKGFFSWNVQTICDAQLKILDIVARWPGSRHDQTIFNNSRIKSRFCNGDIPDCVILGDSGYGNSNYLLTPLSNPLTAAEKLYNESHIRTRNCVERSYGVWKRRFPILSLGMRVNAELSKIIIVATAILHNICIEEKDGDPPIELDFENVGADELPSSITDSNISINNRMRSKIINNHFAHLL